MEMATITVRNVPDNIRDRIRVTAAQNGRSMEAEVRKTLTDTFGEDSKGMPKEEISERIRRVQADFAQYATEDLSVDRFLAERKAMWGED